jgi:hypothetical protein
MLAVSARPSEDGAEMVAASPGSGSFGPIRPPPNTFDQDLPRMSVAGHKRHFAGQPMTSGLPMIVLQKSQNAVQLNFRQTTKQAATVDRCSPNAPPKSPVSSSQNEVVAYINVRSPRVQPGKTGIGETKRLLQHYPPIAEVRRPHSITSSVQASKVAD